MLRTLRIALARRAYLQAEQAAHAYRTQPACGGWSLPVAMALDSRAATAAQRLANAIHPTRR